MLCVSSYSNIVFVCCAVLVYGDFGDDQHIGCFDQACDVLAVAKGLLQFVLMFSVLCTAELYTVSQKNKLLLNVDQFSKFFH